MRSEERHALKALGENIRRERLRALLSQEKLGFATHLDRTYIGGIERGERNCTILFGAGSALLGSAAALYLAGPEERELAPGVLIWAGMAFGLLALTLCGSGYRRLRRLCSNERPPNAAGGA